MTAAAEAVDAAAIGARIRQGRLAKGWTHEQLARSVGVNWRTVQRWQKGDNLPRVPMLLRVADLLDIPRQELVADGAASPVERLAADLNALAERIGQLEQEVRRLGGG